MTKRKQNPLSRSECARLAGLAAGRSPNHYSPFRSMDEDWKEHNGRKGGLECMRRHPDHLKTISKKGAKAKKPKSHYKHVPLLCALVCTWCTGLLGIYAPITQYSEGRQASTRHTRVILGINGG